MSKITRHTGRGRWSARTRPFGSRHGSSLLTAEDYRNKYRDRQTLSFLMRLHRMLRRAA